MPDTPTSTIHLPSSLDAVDAERRRFRQVAAGALAVAVAAAAGFVHAERGPGDRSTMAWTLGVAGGLSALATMTAALGATHAGKTGWAIARRAIAGGSRAAFDRVDRLGDNAPKRAILLAAGALVLGVIVACLDPASGIVVAAPAVLGVLANLFAVLLSAVRMSQMRGALGFMRRLRTSTLTDIGRLEGDVELALRVPGDAPTFQLSFLADPVAAAQVRVLLDDGRWLVRTWPDELPVEDACGQGTLALDAFELGGPRNAHGNLFEAAGEASPLLAALDEVFGRGLRRAGAATSFLWAVWAVLPGDTLYVLGDAPSVRGGVGAYRSGAADRAVRGSVDRAAVAFVGDETRLDATCARELRGQLVTGALGLGAAAALATFAVLAATR